MSEHYQKVKTYLQALELDIADENGDDELVIVNDEDRGLHNLMIDCEEPIVIVEQAIMPIPKDPRDLFKRLLEMNRTLIHGAFALDEETETVLFRNTLRLDTLDLSELDSTITALELALAENAGELLDYSKN